MIPRDRYGLDDIIQAFGRRRWIVLIPFWVVAVATVSYTQSLPNRYESEVRIQLLPASVSPRYVAPAVSSTLAERLPAITEMVLNSDRLQRIVDDLALYRPGAGQSTGDQVAQIRRDFQVRVASSDSFALTYTAPDGKTAQAVASRLASVFIDENRHRSEAAAGAATDFLDSQLEDTRKRLAVNEQQMADFDRRNAGELPSQLQANLQMLQAAQAQLQSVRDAISHDQDDASALDSEIAAETSVAGTVKEPDAATGASGQKAVAESPAQQLQVARESLRELESHLQPQHPDVVRMKRRVAELQAQLAQTQATTAAPTENPIPARVPLDAETVRLQTSRDKLTREVADRQAEASRLETQIQEYEHRIDATPGRQAEILAMTRDYDTLKNLYSTLLAKKEEARVSANLQDDDIGEQFAITSPATRPTRPTSPNRMQLDIVGMLGGFLLGLGLAALVEYRDTSIRTEQDLTIALGLPLLATIPVMLTTSERRRSRSKRAILWAATSLALVATAGVFWRLTQ